MVINNDPWDLTLLDDGTMEGFPSAWDYHESIDELKLKIILELESLHSMREEWRIKEEDMRRKDMEKQRMEAEMKRMEEELERKDVELLRKEEENYQLSQLLKITTQERDVARDELQMLLNKFAQLPNAFNLYSTTPLPLKTESPQEMKMTRGYSSITDPDTPSETHTNLHSFASSPKLSNINMANSNVNMAKYDRGSWIIDCLATQRALPERGNLLQAVQAVTRAAPLLETLLMTGSLPEWRNPPPSLAFHIPTATTVNGRANRPFNLVL